MATPDKISEMNSFENTNNHYLFNYFQPASPHPIYSTFQSNEPNVVFPKHNEIPEEFPPVTVSVTKVSYQIKYDLVPTITPILIDNLGNRMNFSEDITNDDSVYNPPDLSDPRDLYTDIVIQNTKLTRLLLGCALRGFTIWNAPPNFKLLLKEYFEEVDYEQVSNMDTDDNPSSYPPHSQKNQPNRHKRMTLASMRFYNHMISVNLQTISNIICSNHVWGYVLSLQPNSNFPFGAIDVRISFRSVLTGSVSYHLMNVSETKTDVPTLERLLRGLGSDLRKLLGVTLNLSDEQHQGAEGKIASYIIAHLYRLTPNTPYFYVPDSSEATSVPPASPHDIASSSLQEIQQYIETYHKKLKMSWSTVQIEKMFDEYPILQQETENAPRTDSSKLAESTKIGDNTLEQMWTPLKRKVPTLYLFFGTLAILHNKESFYKSDTIVKYCHQAILKKENRYIFATEIISHAPQYNEIAKFLSSV